MLKNGIATLATDFNSHSILPHFLSAFYSWICNCIIWKIFHNRKIRWMANKKNGRAFNVPKVYVLCASTFCGCKRLLEWRQKLEIIVQIGNITFSRLHIWFESRANILLNNWIIWTIRWIWENIAKTGHIIKLLGTMKPLDYHQFCHINSGNCDAHQKTAAEDP